MTSLLRFHADNCFVIFTETDRGQVRATCDPNRQHPYETRIAASILFLNDNYTGGEFYWANLTTAEPSQLVTPQTGRLVYFTAGVENLHGALPMLAKEAATDNDIQSGTPPPRRLTLAMWYVLEGDAQEHVPGYGQKALEAHENPDNRKVLFQIPISFAQSNAQLAADTLRVQMHLCLKRQENIPTKSSWLVHHDEKGVLHMIFKDNSAMFALRIRETVIVVDRFVNGKHPSLQYQLQESGVLHAILDEVLGLAGLTNGSDDKLNQQVLLRLADNGASIHEARKTLPAKRA